MSHKELVKILRINGKTARIANQITSAAWHNTEYFKGALNMLEYIESEFDVSPNGGVLNYIKERLKTRLK